VTLRIEMRCAFTAPLQRARCALPGCEKGSCQARLVNRVKSYPTMLKSLDNFYGPNRPARTVHPPEFPLHRCPAPPSTPFFVTRPRSASVASDAQVAYTATSGSQACCRAA
jgi:hypothetical protein